MKKILIICTIILSIGFAFSCSKSEDSNPAPEPTPVTEGPKFLAVKSVISSSCALSGCHVSPTNAGGINFQTNANIVSNKLLIKAMAVDLGTMPPTGPLQAADKAKITDWINAGGKITD